MATLLSKDKIISLAQLKLGQVSTYGDNRTEFYQQCEKTLEHVVDTLALDTTFLFNSTVVKLTKPNITSETGENVFNKPVDFLVKINSDVPCRIQGEFIYSDSDTVLLRYCRSIQLSEIPTYMERVLIYRLALELAEQNSNYNDKLELLNLRYREEKMNVIILEDDDELWKGE